MKLTCDEAWPVIHAQFIPVNRVFHTDSPFGYISLTTIIDSRVDTDFTTKLRDFTPSRFQSSVHQSRLNVLIFFETCNSPSVASV